MGDPVSKPKMPFMVNNFPVVAAIMDTEESFIIVADRGNEYGERFAVWTYLEKWEGEEGRSAKIPVCYQGDYYYSRPDAIERMIARSGMAVRLVQQEAA